MINHAEWVTAQTREWCVQRKHPFVTYNPLLDNTWCRCGERIEPGNQAVDWDAKRELFHDHPQDKPCTCYRRGY